MDVSDLRPGDPHYMAYVGPPAEYDLMGATQFRLLCTLGLRAHHSLLDVGCGSLRAGRFFISYLDEAKYCGIEPNGWLIDEAIEQQIGRDMIRIKKPRFDGNDQFAADDFGEPFDFILAQSIFSHCGRDLIEAALASFQTALKPEGLIAATFIEAADDFAGRGWVYPGCVGYRSRSISQMAAVAKLSIVRIPWYHPRQSWYLLARDQSRLPTAAMMAHLRGGVLNDPYSGASLGGETRLVRSVKNCLKRVLPSQITSALRNLTTSR